MTTANSLVRRGSSKNVQKMQHTFRYAAISLCLAQMNTSPPTRQLVVVLVAIVVGFSAASSTSSVAQLCVRMYLYLQLCVCVCMCRRSYRSSALQKLLAPHHNLWAFWVWHIWPTYHSSNGRQIFVVDAALCVQKIYISTTIATTTHQKSPTTTILLPFSMFFLVCNSFTFLWA